MTTQKRDYMRSKVKNAEDDFLSGAGRLTAFNKADQRTIQRVMQTAWFQRRCVDYNAAIKNTPFASDHGQDRLRCAHALAHAARNDDRHDPAFVKVYLDLVQHLFNRTRRNEFKQYLIKHNVKTKEVSEATKQKMRDNWNARRMDPREAAEKLKEIYQDLQNKET